MSDSDREFEEYLSSQKDYLKKWSTMAVVGLDNVKHVWNHLYPYKKRCEELESDHKILDEFGIINLAKKCESLESQIKELEEINNMHQLARNKDQVKIKDYEEALGRTIGFILDCKEYQSRDCDCDLTDSECYACFLFDRMDEYIKTQIEKDREVLEKWRRGE